MSDPIARARKAASARRRADAAYRAALQDARDAGHPASTIAAAVGTTRQNVLKLTVSPPPRSKG